MEKDSVGDGVKGSRNGVWSLHVLLQQGKSFIIFTFEVGQQKIYSFDLCVEEGVWHAKTALTNQEMSIIPAKLLLISGKSQCNTTSITVGIVGVPLSHIDLKSAVVGIERHGQVKIENSNLNDQNY